MGMFFLHRWGGGQEDVIWTIVAAESNVADKNQPNKTISYISKICRRD